MRIVFFADSLPPSTDGVAHTFTKLAETLQKSNDDFRFFSPFVPDTNFPWHNKVVKVSSIPLFLYPDYKISLPVLKNIERNLERFKPDIIHSSSPTLLGKIGLTFAEKHKIPAVSSYHTHFISYFKYYKAQIAETFGWSYLKWFYNQFDRIYVPSDSAMNELTNQGFEKLDIWQRGIDTRHFSPDKRNENLRKQIAPQGQPILLFVGRLVKEKDLDDLVEMDRILRRDNQHFKLVVVGDGPMRLELEKKLPKAFFTGILKGLKLAEIYASADIFTFPSTTETFGNVILEAAASGLPSVGVNKGGVQDIILDGQTGFIARANSPADFALYVQVLMNNPSLRKNLSRKAEKFAAKFDWDRINSGLINSYHSIIKEHRLKITV